MALLLMMTLGVFKSVAQTDCTSALVVCGNTNFENLELNGMGLQQEVSSCGSEEHNSLWLKINIKTSGTLSFNIIPESTDLNEDFDFFLFYGDCNELTQIRCSTTHPPSAGLPTNITGTDDLETDFFEGPAELGDGFVKSVVTQEGETYMLVIDRPEGTSNFSIEWTGTAEFNDPPTIVLPPGIDSFDIFKCDADGVPDGATVFDLTQNTNNIIGSQADIVVTYYDNQSNSLLGINPIENPDAYTNASTPQTIYVRAENQLTGCSTTSEFEIGIDGEIALDANQYVICDDAADGNAANGQAIFHMQNVTASVFGSSNTPGFTINYFLTQQNAEDSVNPLPINFYNTTPGQQTVFIKIDNGLCKTIQPVDLIVSFIPAVSAAELVQCDYGSNPDGISVFNLSQADNLFTASNPNLSVAYFENAAALAANMPLSTVYTNVANPQMLMVRITDDVLGCALTNTLTLKVNTVTSQSLLPLEACDISGNGLTQFNLTEANVVTTAQETKAFYLTLQDALLQQNQIANVTAFTNPTAYDASVFVRIDDVVNGCSGISELQLQVNLLPVIEPNDEVFICVNLPGSEVTIDAGLLPPGQIFTYVWKFSNAILPDTTYSIDISQTGIYTVDIVNAENCFSTRTISVLPADLPVIQSVAIDGNSVTINLTELNTGNFTFSIDQPNGPFQAGNFFSVVECGPHIAYVDAGNGCGITTFSFEIMGIPTYFSPNGDGFSDRWNITCGENHPNIIMYIFDRYGRLIKQIGAAGLGWDGTYNGQPLPSDDYWYILNSDDGTTTKGHFALKR